MVPDKTGDARFDAFLPGTGLPRRLTTLTDPGLGQSARALAEALFDRDIARAGEFLARDPQLARVPVGENHDMLIVAIATADAALVTLLLHHGAPPNGRVPGLPLELGLRAYDPEIAHRLLLFHARPTPPARPTAPIRAAIAINSPGAVRLLLDFGADPNAVEETGTRPLQIALRMEHFRIAALLLDFGADPWAIDTGGGNLGASVATPMLTVAPEEAAARRRLAARLKRIGWPEPPPTPVQVRALATSGEWPPEAARMSGAPPVPPFVLEEIARAADRGATVH